MGISVYPHDNHDIEYINYDKLCIYLSISRDIPITSPTVKPNDSEWFWSDLSLEPPARSQKSTGGWVDPLSVGPRRSDVGIAFWGSLKHPKRWNMYGHVIFCSLLISGRFWLFYLFRACYRSMQAASVQQWRILSTNTYGFNKFPDPSKMEGRGLRSNQCHGHSCEFYLDFQLAKHGKTH